MALDAFYLDTPAGQCLCLHHAPPKDSLVHGTVVYVPPFAEEMTKSRRMAALQAQALARAGYAVLQLDLYGTGDSAGDFADANWNAWLQDLARACDWLGEHYPGQERWLWGLRTGCLLAAAAAAGQAEPVHLLLWQPVFSGKQFLQQFLRLKSAGDMLTGESRGENPREQLARGEPVEVAGYTLSPALAAGLEQAELVPDGRGRVVVVEISSRIEPGLSPATASRLEKWRAAGLAAEGLPVNGPSFWQTTEIETIATLCEVSLMALGEQVAA